MLGRWEERTKKGLEWRGRNSTLPNPKAIIKIQTLSPTFHYPWSLAADNKPDEITQNVFRYKSSKMARAPRCYDNAYLCKVWSLLGILSVYPGKFKGVHGKTGQNFKKVT